MKSLGRILGITLLLSTLTLAGGATSAGAAKAKSPSTTSLLGKQFDSISLSGHKALKGKTIRLRFFMHAKTTGATKAPTMVFPGGCNAMGANYRAQNGRLVSRGSFLGTAIGCKKGTSPDKWLARNFKSGWKAKVIGNRLVLSRPGKKAKLVFRQVRDDKVKGPVVVDELLDLPGAPATREDLDGKSFVSTHVTGVVLKKPVKLTFTTGTLMRNDDEGNQIKGDLLTASLGCNAMGGEYRVESGELLWLDVVGTLMACRYNMDGWFHQFLAKGVKAETDGNRLALTSGTTQIILKEVPTT